MRLKHVRSKLARCTPVGVFVVLVAAVFFGMGPVAVIVQAGDMSPWLVMGALLANFVLVAMMFMAMSMWLQLPVVAASVPRQKSNNRISQW